MIWDEPAAKSHADGKQEEVGSGKVKMVPTGFLYASKNSFLKILNFMDIVLAIPNPKGG